jgi:hypothetical protein
VADSQVSMLVEKPGPLQYRPVPSWRRLTVTAVTATSSSAVPHRSPVDGVPQPAVNPLSLYTPAAGKDVVMVGTVRLTLHV